MLAYIKAKFMSSTLPTLLEEAGVPTLTAADSEYTKIAAPYNLRLSYKPVAIAVPRTVTQVQAAIKLASSTHTKVAARSGGHSYAAHGLGGQDGSLIIDLTYFTHISVDASTGIATVGGGVRLGNLASELWCQGRRACPHGSCPGVGLAGHALLGGFGHTSRMWGLAVDSIISLSVVLADGSVVTASENENTELYWALRGAGPSFGIVVEMTLRTFPAPQNNIIFSYLYRSAKPAVAARAFMAVQRFGAKGPPGELGVGVEVRAGELKVRGAYYGALPEFHAVLDPLILELDSIYASPADEIQVREMGWIESLEAMSEGKPLLVTPGKYDEHDTFFAKSLVEPAAAPLTEANILSLFTYLSLSGTTSLNSWCIIINLYGGPNSAITRSPHPPSSCYGHRDCLFVFQLYAHTPSHKPNADMGSLVPFVDGMVAALVGREEGGRFGGYPGYMDPTLEAGKAHVMYYGDAYPRLKEVKKKVDPKWLFWNPLAVGES